MKKIGPYEVLGLLGRGGMSRVYKVRHCLTERIFALKLLSPNLHLETLLGREEISKRFVAEADVMKQLDHPNIIKCHDFGDHQGRPYIVMEYYCHNIGNVIGETYRYENPSRPLTREKVIRYTRETLLGLASLHEQGIVHRDIKPFNLLLDWNETLKITDFGLSRLRGEIFPGHSQVIVGSPYYAAPEQEKDPDRADAQSDLYSVGVLFHRMLTGWLPRDNGERVVFPSSQDSELDAAWNEFLLKATAVNKGERYDSAACMLGDLDRLEQKWDESLAEYCASYSSARTSKPPSRAAPNTLRSHAIKVAPDLAQQKLGTDRLWRPAEYFKNDFRDNCDGTISDKATQLTWQKSGSQDAMPWREAHQYIKALNGKGFGGINNWRLPTIEELKSTLTPPPEKGDYCLQAIFDRTKKWLWSCDRCSFISAWYVSAEQGYISRQDFTCYFFVRAVSSEKK